MNTFKVSVEPLRIDGDSPLSITIKQGDRVLSFIVGSIFSYAIREGGLMSQSLGPVTNKQFADCLQSFVNVEIEERNARDDDDAYVARTS